MHSCAANCFVCFSQLLFQGPQILQVAYCSQLKWASCFLIDVTCFCCKLYCHFWYNLFLKILSNKLFLECNNYWRYFWGTMKAISIAAKLQWQYSGVNHMNICMCVSSYNHKTYLDKWIWPDKWIQFIEFCSNGSYCSSTDNNFQVD